MAAFIGPHIPNSNLLFYVDGKNQKSYFDDTLKSLVSNEQASAKLSNEDGYLYSDFKSVDKFEQIDISDKEVLTAHIIVKQSPLSRGTVFSISSDNLIGYSASAQTSYSPVSSITTAKNELNYDDNIAASTQTLYSSSSLTTAAKNELNYGDNIAASSKTLYLQLSSTTAAKNELNYGDNIDSTAQTLYSSTSVSTTSNYIDSFGSNNKFEISVFANSSGIIAIHKNEEYMSQIMAVAETQEINQYSIIFRNYDSNVIPITIYINGKFSSNSLPEIVDVPVNFQNSGLALFNKNNSRYLNHGVRSVIIYGRELNESEIQLINRVELVKN